MEDNIHKAEAEHAELQELASDPEIIADRAKHEEVCHKLGDAQKKVDQLYARWEELEAMST